MCHAAARAGAGHAPQAGHCLDCNPNTEEYPGNYQRYQKWGPAPLCKWRGCQPASAIVKLASVARR